MWDPTKSSKRKTNLGSTTIKRHAMLTLNEQQRFQLAAFARRYDLVGANGVGIRTPEVVRLLMVVALTDRAAVAASVEVAIRTNVKAMVANYGNRLSSVVGGKEMSRDTLVVVPRQTMFTVDGPMAERLETLVPYYRTKNNRNLLGHMALALVEKALQDPRLDDIAKDYAAIINPFHRKMIDFTEQMQKSLAAMTAKMTAKLTG